MDFWHSPNRLLSCAAATIQKGLSRPHLVGKERVAAVKDMGDGVDLVGS